MFRVRLAAVIAVSFCFVLGLGGLIYWGSSQVALDFQRSQSAYEAFDRYERVSHEAYRYFKQRMDSLVTNTEAAEAGGCKNILPSCIVRMVRFWSIPQASGSVKCPLMHHGIKAGNDWL